MLQHALKEWSVAVDALVQGQTILLLRKGGIREVGNHFQVPHQRVWLYPTYEHQKPNLLKPQWATQVTPVAAGWHPTQVTIQAWANITHVWTVRTEQSVNSLLPFHIWNEQFVTERFRWKPSQPLHLLLMRVYQLTTPVQLDWQAAYGGCRSWLNLETPKDTRQSAPVLDEQTWTVTGQKIYHQIQQFETIGPWQGNEIF
ncbi:hypothetical protein Lepto7375DRAFT_3612 [Leptolyngbya sp. PCC 7375]|nr:hypothetical protein Lepto7375DRAFT_3612 [Leptolyngbya sp. PCC 7375]